jgi:hypothetical protein
MRVKNEFEKMYKEEFVAKFKVLFASRGLKEITNISVRIDGVQVEIRTWHLLNKNQRFNG